MSYFNKNVASRMAVNGRRRHINTMEFEEPTEYVLVAENEAIEDTMIIREEELMRYGGRSGRSESLFEDTISQPIETVRPTKKLTTNFVDAERIKEEWFEEVDVDEIDRMSPTDEGSNSMIQYQANTSDELNDGEDDEETVAVFVTASGQQLALYAVEDSDDIFAVAMYDESGNPPSHFQFLMKSDVERLIVEGAVRTVKKPSQIKKELITDEPVSFIPKTELLSRDLSATDLHIEEELEEEDDDEDDGHLIYHRTKRDWDERILPDPHTDDEIHFNRPTKNRSIPNIVSKKPLNDEKFQKPSKIIETENEILEQSTVQYIFLESEQTESELTFDDIQTTLKNFKFSNKRRANASDVTERTSNEYPKSPENVNTTYHSSDKEDDTNFELNFEEESFSSVETTHFSLIDTTTNDSFNLQTSHVKQELETPKKDVASDLNVVKSLTFKTKRSRKQQFTSVNRGDSEIIIQPASIFLEEEQENESVKKKKRRKRKLPIRGNNNNSHNAKAIHSRKLRKRRKRRAVEVIELDTDEEERSPMVTRSKRDIVEVDLEGNSKEKYSSDKENEVILLADSDEEDDASSSSSTDNMKLSPLLRCKYCLRSFRQKSALETHVRLCPKSPANARRYEKKVRSNTSSNKSISNKEYSCKICQEKFDVVVALARHVRFEHSLKKKSNSANTANKPNETPQAVPKTTTVKKEVVKPPEEKPEEKEEKEERKKKEKDSIEKRINRRTRMWDTKKHNCPDCGKWFPSAAILAAHCLQHATKNTEKQLRKCRSCKKMLRSRILYIQHMKMHSTAQNTVISLRRSYQRNPRNKRRVNSSNTAIHRRRGKPRKW